MRRSLVVVLAALAVVALNPAKAQDPFRDGFLTPVHKLIQSNAVFIGTLTNIVRVSYSPSGRYAANEDELGILDSTFSARRWIKGRDALREGEVSRPEGAEHDTLTVRERDGTIDRGGGRPETVGSTLEHHPIIMAKRNELYVFMLDRRPDGSLRITNLDGYIRLDEEGKTTFLAALASVKALREQLDAALADVATVQALTDEQVTDITPAVWKVEEHPAPVMVADPRANPQVWVDWWALNRPKFLIEEVTAVDLE